MADLRDELNKVAQRDIDELVKKDAEYGSSWKRRGGIGAYMMLARKIDRIEQQVKAHGYDIFAAAATDARAEGIRDDIGDLRRYLMLVETEISQKPTTMITVATLAEVEITTARPALRAPIYIPFINEIIMPWRCPRPGERVWDDSYKRRGIITEVLQDGDAGIRFDDGKPPFSSKWHRMWILVDQTSPPQSNPTGQEHPF